MVPLRSVCRRISAKPQLMEDGFEGIRDRRFLVADRRFPLQVLLVYHHPEAGQGICGGSLLQMPETAPSFAARGEQSQLFQLFELLPDGTVFGPRQPSHLARVQRPLPRP